MTNNEQEFLTVNELADLLRLPVRTIYYMNHRRTGPPSIKVGKHLRYRREAVNAWLEQKEAVNV